MTTNKTKNGKIKRKAYEAELARLAIELVKYQEWVRSRGLRIVVLFEGRDAAGKGGAIKRIMEPLNPRHARVAALPAPSDRERTQWYFQRYVAHLPAAGEIVLFDRSWYNRAGVERVMGFATPDEVEEFFRSAPAFEQMLIHSGIQLVKYWFSVSDAEQERRFHDRLNDPTRRWKLSPMDLESRSRWVEYSIAKDDMFAHTDIEAVAVVCRGGRRQAAGSAERHQPPPEPGPVRRPDAGGDRTPAASARPRLRAAASLRPDLRAEPLLTELEAQSRSKRSTGSTNTVAPPTSTSSG